MDFKQKCKKIIPEIEKTEYGKLKIFRNDTENIF